MNTRAFNNALAEQLVKELARPRPRLYVLTNRFDYSFDRKVNPFTGQELVAVTMPLARTMEDYLSAEQNRNLSEFMDVEEVDYEYEVRIPVENPDSMALTDPYLPGPDDLPPFLEIRLRP